MFQINTEPLTPLESFPYLGRTIALNNSDWLAVFQNLNKARRWWGMILRVLTKTEAMVCACGRMSKVLAQSVIM